MSNGLEGRVARLERAVAYSLGIDIAEHDDKAQAEARALQAEADQKAGYKALDAIRAELEAVGEEA